MRIYFFIGVLTVLGNTSLAQTNTFPTNGNVGIGTLNPTVGLQLGNLNADVDVKQILIPGVYNFERFKLGHLGNGNMAFEMVNHSDYISSYGMRLMTNIDQGGQGLQFQYASSRNSYEELEYHTGMFFTTAGKLGIGTLSPSSLLDVNGTVRAKEIKVEVTEWPDYVFTKSYQLLSLQETEDYIKEKGHLPGIPSASEVKSNGIDIGEMNAKLLQKIEELTLYLIEMEKKVERQQKEINCLISK